METQARRTDQNALLWATGLLCTSQFPGSPQTAEDAAVFVDGTAFAVAASSVSAVEYYWWSSKIKIYKD